MFVVELRTYTIFFQDVRDLSTTLLSRFSDLEMCFVDVGANVGYYTILRALKDSFVVAVEPIPTTVAVLKINLKLNGIINVMIVDKCAWFESSRIKLKIPHGSYYGLASAFYNRDTKYVAYEVECVKLDDVLKEFKNIKLVKIDVEGAEYEVLKRNGKVFRQG